MRENNSEMKTAVYFRVGTHAQMKDSVEEAASSSSQYPNLKRSKMALYSRVARDGADVLENQKDRLRAYVRELDVYSFEEYSDVGIGADLSRPGLSAMMMALADGRVDTIVVKDLSRLVRGAAEWAQLYKEIEEMGGSVVSENWGLERPIFL